MNTSQLSNQLYNCDHHLHHGHRHYQHRHHHHALYITHEEQDGQRASGRITVTPHIWLSKLHCCNERRPTKLYCTQLAIWLRLFFCTAKQLISKDTPYQSPKSWSRWNVIHQIRTHWDVRDFKRTKRTLECTTFNFVKENKKSLESSYTWNIHK